MPHTNRKQATPAPKANDFQKAIFVNPTLSTDDKFAIKMEGFDTEAFDNALTRLTIDGYKITIRYDDRNQCFACWFIAPDKEPNKGYILAGRGSTPMKAVKQTAYVHFKMLEGDWTEGGDIPRDTIDD